MAAQSEVGLDPLLEGSQVQLLEACDLVLREGLEGKVRERRSAPESECCAERLRGVLGLARGEKLSTLDELTLEAGGVELFALESEEVPVTAGLQAAVPERPAQPRDVDVDAVRRARRRAFPPQHVDQALRRDHLAGAQEEERKERPLLAGADVELPPELGHLERAEDAVLERVVTGQAHSFSARVKRRTRANQAARKRTGARSGLSFSREAE